MIFDRLEIDSVNRALEVREEFAGKANNAARVVKALGHRPVAMGFAGGDRGKMMLAGLAHLGIEHEFVQIKHQTRLCVTVIDSQHHTATELVEETPPVEQADVDALLGLLGQRLGGADILVLSGSLAPGVGVEFYARCIELAHERRVRVLVDASGEALSMALPARPDWVKPNRSELGRTIGEPIESDAHLEAVMRQVVTAGAGAVVVTQGAGPVVAFDGEHFARFGVPQLRPVSAIGSGDAFAAGLAVGCAAGQSLIDSVRLGAACGAANALTSVAGEIHPVDVHRLLGEIAIES